MIGSTADIRWGLHRGLCIAAVFCIYVVIMAVMQRSIAFDRYGSNVFQLLLMYLAGGTLGGAISGLLRPLNRTLLGGALIGALASIPFWMGCLMLLAGMPSVWDRGDWVVLMILSGLGALFGAHMVRPNRETL